MTDFPFSNIASMTGFTRVSGADETASWSFELRSVNGKNLDIKARLPHGFDALDAQLKPLATKYLERGKISISSQIDFGKQEQDYTINEALLEKLLCLAEKYEDRLAKPSFECLLGVKGVLELSEQDPQQEAETDKILKKLIETLDLGFKNLAQTRQEEGAKLAPVLIDQLTQLETLINQAETLAERQPQQLQEKLSRQIQELLSESLPQERLAQEVALLATKADVREETDRLKAHIKTAYALFKQGSPIGRKLDFLCQEFNREANTLCSKSSSTELTNIGLSLKSVIEQFREQVQNIE